MVESSGFPGLALPRFQPPGDATFDMQRSVRSREPITRTRIKFIRILLVAGGLTVLSGISVLFGMLMAVAPEVKSLQTSQEFKTAQNSVLKDRDGQFLAELTSNDGRVILKTDQISRSMKQAVVAIEDRRFYQHDGVDLRGVSRAVLTDVIERKAAQGASTIEQQFIKIVSKDQDQRTISNKLREIALAYHLSHKWSKDKILTEYLNAIYYANGAHGIEAAARTYFSTQHPGCGTRLRPCAAELRPAEAGLLAGIINSPSAFDPVANPVDAQRRRNIVLTAMRAQGMLNPVAYSEAMAEPIPAPEQVKLPKLRLKTQGSGYFTGWVSAQLAEEYGAKTAFEGGLRVRTTLDSKMQNAAEESIGAWLTGTGPVASLVAIDNGTGEVRAMVGGGNYDDSPFNIATHGRRQPGSAFKPFVLATALRSGISPSSTWESRKREFKFKNGGSKETFVVNNYDDQYAGITTLANATVHSDNAVFAEVGLKVGTKKIAKLANQMGIRTKVSTNPSMTLGGINPGLSPLDLAHAYETLATGGKLTSGTLGAAKRGPVGIRSIESLDGKVKQKENETTSKRVLDPAIAAQTTNILAGVVKSGTGTAAAIPGQLVWGKTGTTENYGDAWFVGATADITVAIWVGYPNETRPMLTEYHGEPVTGGTFPAQIWRTFVTKAVALDTARRDRLCEQKAKKGDPCADQVVPTTPPVQAIPDGTTTPATPSTTPATPVTPSTGGTGTGTGTDTPSKTPVTPATPTPTPAEPVTPVTPPATGDVGGVTPGT